MLGIDAPWLWLVAGLLLALAEIVAPGVFLVWLGGAALLTGLVTLGLGLGVAAQFASFAVAALAAVYAGRSLVSRYPTISDDPLLNDRGARLVGRVVEVVEAIRDGEGRVRVGDSVWGAVGPDAAPGERLLVTGLRGGRLSVERPAALPEV